MKRITVGMLIMMSALISGRDVLAQPYQIPGEFWQAPRSGQAVLALQPLREDVQAMLADPSASLRLIHGPGEDAQANAGELRSWLIALGIDANRIVVTETPSKNQSITVELVETK